MIAELIAKTGEARLTDLARGLGVTHVTANRTLKRLQRQGSSRASPIVRFFSPAKDEASRRNHATATRPSSGSSSPSACRDVAESDAEGIEHHVSRETLAAFVRHLSGGR